MSQILQLYICCYQHESMQETCCRDVLPVWNYTIQCACENFVTQHAYQVDTVIDCLIKCILD